MSQSFFIKQKNVSSQKNMSPIKTERQECVVYSRVVGWLAPVQNFNKGKAAEYKDRKTYKVEDSCC